MTTGEGRVIVEYLVNGRQNENQSEPQGPFGALVTDPSSRGAGVRNRY